MSRVLPGSFRETGAPPSVGRPHEITLLDALDALTPAQRATMTGLIREFAGTMKKPNKGANHRTRDLLAFLTSPAVLDWFTVGQLHHLAGRVAIAAYVRAHEDGTTTDDADHEKGGA